MGDSRLFGHHLHLGGRGVNWEDSWSLSTRFRVKACALREYSHERNVWRSLMDVVLIRGMHYDHADKEQDVDME